METIYLIIENTRTHTLKFIRCEDYTFGDFIKTAQCYANAGFNVRFKRFV